MTSNNKMKKITLIIIFGFQLIFANGQSHVRKAYEDITYSVVYLEREIIEQTHYNDSIYQVWLKPLNKDTMLPKLIRYTGTGFLTYYEDFLFLITAQHVAEKMTFDSKIYFSNKNNKPYVIKLGDLINYEPASWTFNNESDLAIIMISPTDEYLDSLRIKYIPQSVILKQRESPSRDTKLTIIGFPLGLGIQDIFSPITKTTYPASDLIKLKNPVTKKLNTYFLLSDPSTSGFSGAPVFKMPVTQFEKNKIYTIVGVTLHGLISATISDETGGKFAAVVPSYLIFESLKNARKFSVKFIYKYKNGNPWSEVIYKNGKPWTVIYNFDSIGKPQKKGTLKNGNGTLYIYDEKSNLISIMKIKTGEIISVEDISSQLKI